MKTFLVGGAVRDQIMGVESHDLDYVVVGGTPEEMLRVGFQQVGADFPVFLDPATGDEHALARTERKVGDGHKGFVTQHDPSVTLESDLMRRDFTMNAMARSLDHLHPEIIDPFGGQDDIRDGIIRHVSDAFRDDPLRVLRAARFAARFDFVVASETMEIMTDMVASGELDNLSPERIWKEVNQAMQSFHPDRFFEVLRELDALHVLGIHNSSDLIEFVLLNSRNNDSQCRWMRFSLTMDDNDREGFFKATKCPNDIKRLIEFAPAMQLSFDINDVDGIMQVAKRFRLFEVQNHDLLATFKQVMENIYVQPHVEKFDKLWVAFLYACDVCFDSLNDNEKETLVGPAIGQAIFNRRKSMIKRAMNNG